MGADPSGPHRQTADRLGAAIALRVLDIINHLDLSQFLFIDRAFEVVWVGLHLATDSLSDLLTVSEA